MDHEELLSAVEAILFAAGEPIEASRVGLVLGEETETIISCAKELADAYENWRAGEIADAEYLRLSRAYIERKYSRENLFTFAAYFPVDRPDMFMYTRSGYNEAMAFVSGLQNDILRLGETIDTAGRFVHRNGKIYLVRNLLNLRMERYGMLVLGIDRDVMFGPLLSLAQTWQGRAFIRLDGEGDTEPDWDALTPGLSEEGGEIRLVKRSQTDGIGLDLLITLDDAFWFVRKDAFEEPDSETADSFLELRSDGVSICDYADIAFSLSSLKENGVDRICVDPSALNLTLWQALKQADDAPEVVPCPSPVALRKAVKNSVELDGMREAHLEDGVVMEQFLYWLSQHVGQVNEWEAACELGRLRATIPGYRGDSFETISAYGPSAALPHYVTPKTGSALLEPRGLYLVDSGGQYLFGTTDITRTVPLGPCTPLEREDYTLVLKGHIGLAMAVFPRGTAGCQIDALAREPLWRHKRNFGHGTGHGVGFFLGVHEGPHDIRQNFNTQPLEPGMVTSNEPGLYREGLHGIRHENLMLARPVGDNEFGSFLGFETLTLCHFDTSCLDGELLTADEREWLNAYNQRVFATLSPRLPAPVAAWLREKTLPV